MAARLPDRQKAKSTYRFQESIDRFPGLSHSDLLGHCFPVGLLLATSALSGVLTLKESHCHDLEIKNQTPIFHVPDVVINPLG
jgi:hypothetical protein